MPPGSNIYEDCLQLAQAAGVPLPQASTSELTAHIDAACSVADAYRDVYQRQLDILEQEDFMAWENIAHKPVLVQREANLRAASSTLRTVIASKDTIARRLRAASTVPNIPVDPQYQPDLSVLLQHSAGGQAILAHGAGALQWAAGFQERPSCWEDRLQAIPEALKACQDQQHALQRFSEALAARAAAAGGCAPAAAPAP